MADHQRGQATPEQAVHAGLPRGHARDHHPRQAPRPETQRPGQLLREPRACSERHARRYRQSENRHHELSRIHVQGKGGSLQGRTVSPPGPGRTPADARNRRTDAPARHAGAHGAEKRLHHERRSASLLPRETSSRCRAFGRRKERSGGEQRGRPRVDFRPRDCGQENRGASRSRPVGDAFFPPGFGVRGRHAFSLDDVRLLPHGRDRMRHRQAAARARGRQYPRQRNAQVPGTLETYRHKDAKKRAGARGATRPLEHPGRASDRTGSALRPLQENLRSLGRSGNQGCALLHHHLQQHRDFETRVRLRLGLPT